MSQKNTHKNEQWGSRLGFILAAMGMAVGTGNIWRFPRIVGSNHGGSFILAYTITNLIWVVPLLMMEMGIGKTTRLGAIGSFRDFYGKNKTWLGGWITFVCAAITFYYAVVFGYAMRYFVYAVQGVMKPGFDSAALWENFVNSPGETILFHGIAVLLTGFVIYRGVKNGLEAIGKVAIPTLFISLIIAAVWAISQPGSSVGLKYLFVPEWAALGTSKLWLNALTQSAWSAGAGWAMMLTYANYFKKNEDIAVNSFMITFGDALGALTAALAVLPAVFALSASEGAAVEALSAGNYGLTFVYIAKLFSNIPAGRMISIIFFLALSLAALTSIIPQTEVIVRNFVNAGFSREKSTIIVCVGVFILGVPSAYSIDILNNQDWVWGIGLLVSGLFFAMAVYKYGVDRFRNEIINSCSDIYVGKWFNYCVRIFPVLLAIVVGWWTYQSIIWHPEDWWNPFVVDSVGTVVAQWVITGILFYLANNWLANWIKDSSPMGTAKSE
ncbi:sodium-dependent transporter [Geosporobacter ferrireducens]|uniref:Sodium:calcium symporter n=1 Tax=Geosporobacter ferrireducens TaxID=1424294 RepID=A0A1D8GJ73_9FIRM|nr:sodium-dependent transporter [Geosporobacter ferrireducens]AOT70975.1 sodium:calcium symporter [Geosporobacter ferrireducens]MTI53690.1 sodium-dependent transporter [Geosporobacter ferrireducens]